MERLGATHNQDVSHAYLPATVDTSTHPGAVLASYRNDALKSRDAASCR